RPEWAAFCFVQGGFMLPYAIEKIELSTNFNNERTLKFQLILCRSSGPVLTACLAQSRASSRDAWLTEQGAAPASVARNHGPGGAVTARPRRGVCLRWLDGCG